MAGRKQEFFIELMLSLHVLTQLLKSRKFLQIVCQIWFFSLRDNFFVILFDLASTSTEITLESTMRFCG